MTRAEHWFWPATAAFFFLALWALKGMLLPFVLGLAIAYFLDPLADRIERLGAGRTLSAVAVLVFFVAIFVTALALAFPLLQEQFMRFAAALPVYVEKARDAAMPFIKKAHEQILQNRDVDLQQEASGYAARAFEWASGLAARIWNSGLAFFDVLSILIVTPVVAFYMLRDWDVMTKKVDAWLPRRHAPVIRDLARQMDAVLSGFVHGQATVCFALGAVYGLALTFAGLDFGFLIGFMAGVLSFIPYVGSLAGFATAMLVAWFQFDGETSRLLVIAAIFIAGQFLEGNVLTPKLVGEKVGLHAVWILFALMAGGTLMGFTGVMIAVPVAALAGVLARFLIGQYLKSSYYTGKGVRPA